MKFGVHTWLWTTKFLEKDLQVFEKVQKMGYDGIEIHLGFPELLPIQGIKKKMQETGLKCTFSAGLTKEQNVASSNPEIRNNGIKLIKNLIDVASELEGDVICGILYGPWGEFPPSGRRPEELDYAKESLLKVADYAKNHGVVLALEPINRFEGYLICTAEEILEFVKQVNHPNVKIHLDTFQMNIEENDLLEAFRIAKDHLYHVHLCENHRGVPGTGTMPWREIFKTLREINYDRWVVYEAWVTDVFLRELGEVPSKIAMWRRLITDSDVAAEQAIRFFKHVEKTI